MGTADKADVADGFLCPITCLVMRDPVMLTGDGHTYERCDSHSRTNTHRHTNAHTRTPTDSPTHECTRSDWLAG